MSSSLFSCYFHIVVKYENASRVIKAISKKVMENQAQYHSKKVIVDFRCEHTSSKPFCLKFIGEKGKKERRWKKKKKKEREKFNYIQFPFLPLLSSFFLHPICRGSFSFSGTGLGWLGSVGWPPSTLAQIAFVLLLLLLLQEIVPFATYRYGKEGEGCLFA